MYCGGEAIRVLHLKQKGRTNLTKEERHQINDKTMAPAIQGNGDDLTLLFSEKLQKDWQVNFS